MELFAAATTVQALTEAWHDLLADDRRDGTLASGTRRFAVTADDRIAELAERLSTGAYRPGTLTPGGHREGRRWPRRCRRWWTCGWGPRRSPTGPVWVSPTPSSRWPGCVTKACAGSPTPTSTNASPPSTYPGVRGLLAAIVHDPRVLALVDLLISRKVAGAGGLTPLRGLAQGAPLSPLLANLALEHLDDRLRAAGFPIVRYGDDVLVLAATPAEARRGLRMVHDAAHDIDMRVGDDSSEVMSFDDGFCFLGEDFGPRYPPVLDDHRIVEPATRTVYVGVPGAGVRLEAGRIVVTSPDDTELLDVPSGHVERLVLFGPVGLTAGARSWALTNNVEVVIASRRGNYLGQLLTGTTRRVHRLRAQIACSDDPDRWLPFARSVVDAKVRKQVVLVQRLTRREHHEELSDAVDAMRTLLAMLPDAGSRDELMGLEGAAAREYFTALSLLVPEPLRFAGRSRRPPMDVINAALSYGYTILLGEAVAALAAAGLDPAIGLLHTSADNRPSLALDLIEEFRPLIVDQVVITAARQHRIGPQHSRTDDGRPGVLLTAAGREALIDAYEKRMLHTTRGALAGYSGSLRRHLHRQAQRVAAYIDHGQPWTGLGWR